jgi:prepilin-type N-terminal cleavage/methylation domain-containing protein
MRDAWREIRCTDSRKPTDEQGFTLVEMMVTLSVMGLVLAITVPLVSMFYDVNNDVQQTYAATNQVILASEVLTQYLHEAVAPCPPTSTKCSTTAFSSSPVPSATVLTFYADTNNPNGPSEVVMSMSGTTMTAAVYQPNAGTCPFNGSLSIGCTYPSTFRLLASVPDLTALSPFSYDTQAGASGSGVCSTTNSPPTTGFAGTILAICVNLQAHLRGGQPTGFVSLAYALASAYNGSVG